jgi:hypothetical protein
MQDEKNVKSGTLEFAKDKNIKPLCPRATAYRPLKAGRKGEGANLSPPRGILKGLRLPGSCAPLENVDVCGTIFINLLGYKEFGRYSSLSLNNTSDDVPNL